MATTALVIGASPLILEQGTLLATFRPLPSKPVKLSTVAFSYQRCLAPIIFKNPKPPQSYSFLARRTTHYLTADSKSSDHTRLSSQRLNVSQENRPPAANPNIISKLWDKYSLEAFKKPATAAVMLGLLVMYNPNSVALAAPAGFDKLVVREKVRYDEETVVNEDNTKPQSTASQKSNTDESHNDDVTVLPAADGEYSKSLTITYGSDVKRELEELASMDHSKQAYPQIPLTSATHQTTPPLRPPVTPRATLTLQ